MQTNRHARPAGWRRRRLITLPIAAAGSWLLAARPARAGSLTLGGTGSGVAPLRSVLESLRIAATFVPNLGSGGGLKALAAGAIDLAIVARRLTDAERAAGLVEHEAFRTPFVWAVHAAVPLERASVAELTALYSGRSERWPNGEPVRLILRPESDSDTLLVKALFPALGAAAIAAGQRPGMKVAITDDEAIGDIERIDGALGTTTLSMVFTPPRSVRVLALEGVVPGVNALAAGDYPAAKRIALVTRGAPQGDAKTLLGSLGARSAAQLLARSGCLAADPR